MRYALFLTLLFSLVSAAMFTAAPILADKPNLALEDEDPGSRSQSGLGRVSETDSIYENDIACFSWGARQFHPLTVDSSCCYLDRDRELFLVSGTVHCCCYRSRLYQG